MGPYRYEETSSYSFFFRKKAFISADIYLEETKIFSLESMSPEDVRSIVFHLNTAYELGHSDGQVIGQSMERTLNDFRCVAQ